MPVCVDTAAVTENTTLTEQERHTARVISVCHKNRDKFPTPVRYTSCRRRETGQRYTEVCWIINVVGGSKVVFLGQSLDVET